MTDIAALIVRLFAVLAGFIVAMLAASAFLHVVAWPAFGLTPEDAAWAIDGPLLFTVPFAALFLAWVAFVPTAIAIAIGELLGARDWLFYAIVGGAVAVGLGGFAWLVAPDGTADAGLLAAVAGAGMVGGIGYWLVAGRGAGSWRRPPTPRG